MRSALIACLVCSAAYGQDLEVKSRTYYKLAGAEGMTTIGGNVFFDTATDVKLSPVGVIRIDTEASNVEVVGTNQAFDPIDIERVTENVYVIDRPGKYRVDVTAIDFEKKIYGRKTVIVEVGEGPNPPPTPDPPGPTPGPAPIDGDGLRVVIVYETADASKLTKEQQEIFYSPTIRDYLDENCAKGPDGKTADWRLLDKDTKFTSEDHRFAKVLARDRTSLPWIVISNGQGGYEGPLTGTVSDTLSLIKSFKK